MRLFLLTIAATVGFAQTTVSLAPEGPQITRAYLGRNVDGIGVWSVSVCSPVDDLQFAGLLHAAISNGVVLMTTASVDALQDRLTKRSPGEFAADAGEGLSMLATGLIAAKIIAATNMYLTAGLMTAGALHWLSGKLKAKAPDPARVRSLIIPAILSIRAGSCVNLEALGTWSVQSKPFTVIVP